MTKTRTALRVQTILFPVTFPVAHLLGLALAVALPACRTRAFHSTTNDTASAERELFASESVVKFRIEAPFSDLLPTKVAQRGAIVLEGGQKIPVDVSQRGNTSLGACTFPKLEVQIGEGPDGDAAKAAARGTLLEKTGSFNIGTHCDIMQGGDPLLKAGRLGTELSVFRELTVYRMIRAYLGEETHRYRPAEITYVDTAKGTSVMRQALLLERKKPLAKRIGAEVADENSVWYEDLDPVQFARTTLAFGLSGSGDFYFLDRARYHWSSPPPRPTHVGEYTHWWWNAYPVRDKATGKAKIIPYDFDIGSLVNLGLMKHRYSNPEFLGGEPRLFRNAVGIIQIYKQQHSPEAFGKAVEDLRAARTRIDAAIDGSPVDAEGRAEAKGWHAALQRAIEPEWLDLRTIAKSSTDVFIDKARTRKACSAGLTAGEPIVIAEEAGGMARLKTVYAQDSEAGCGAEHEPHEKDVWVASDALTGTKVVTPMRRPAEEDIRPPLVVSLYVSKKTVLKVRKAQSKNLTDADKCWMERLKSITGTTTRVDALFKDEDLPFTLSEDVKDCPFAKKGTTIWLWGAHWGIAGG